MNEFKFLAIMIVMAVNSILIFRQLRIIRKNVFNVANNILLLIEALGKK